MNEKNGNGSMRRRFYLVLALAVVAVLASGIVIRQAASRLTKGLTELAPSLVTTDAQNDVTDVPDPRDTEQFTMPEPAEEEEEEPESTSAAAAPTETPTQKAAAQVQNNSFVLPLKETKILKEYSPQVPMFSATMGDWRVHPGIDFAAKEGDAVLSVGNGVVTKITSDTRWGYVIEVDHGSFTAKYCSVSQDGAVSIGTVLRTGEVLGEVQTSPLEQEDGCHLHFETTRNGAQVDPLEALGMME